MAKIKTCLINLKNNLLFDDAEMYAKELNTIDIKYKLILAPGDCFLTLFNNQNYALCAQNISTYDFICTGEVSPDVLKSLKCKYVLVGHTERRKLYDDEYTIEKRVKTALKGGLRVIYYIGEDSRQNPFFLKEIIKNQIKNVLDYIDPNLRDHIILAYEPGWLIGKNELMLLEDIGEIVTFIKDFVYKKYNMDIEVLYGGGINPDNVDKVCLIDELDGIVISSAALNLKNLKSLIG